MNLQITVIGLGRIGTSIGLALASELKHFHRLGHDREPKINRKAKKLGAFDQTHLNLQSSVKNADIVILAIPVDEIQETLRLIAPDLKAGTLVLDTSSIIMAVASWANELLPTEQHFVSFTPSENPKYLYETTTGIDSAHADLFENSLILISPPASSDPEILQLISDLAIRLRAKPLFADPMEADGLIASCHLLPKLIAAALLNATIEQPGWHEARKLAGRAYSMITEPILHLGETNSLGQSALLNQNNALRVLDDLMTALQDLRDSIAKEDSQTLHNLLDHARQGRISWLKQRQASNWDIDFLPSSTTTSDNPLGRFIGFNQQK